MATYDPMSECKSKCRKLIESKKNHLRLLRFFLLDIIPDLQQRKDQSPFEIFDLLERCDYIRKADIGFLWRLFNLSGLDKCRECVDKCLKEQNLGNMNATESSKESIDISDVEVYDYATFIEAAEMRKLAIQGFCIGYTVYSNTITKESEESNNIAVFFKWKCLAPLPQEYIPRDDSMPPFTKVGLRFALERAKLLGVATKLKLI